MPRRRFCLLVGCVVLSLITSLNAAVCLRTNEPERLGGGESLLVRELARQALLIAARDQLGLPTRDQTLRESFPADREPLNITTAFKVRNFLRVDIAAAGENPAWSREYRIPNVPSHEAIPVFLAQLEEASRGEMVELLQARGAVAQPIRPAGDADVPAEIEQALQKMDMFQQFVAIRQLHRLIHEHGHSPQLTGALVRGYANLGQLTQFQWPAFHQAFKARALLYAQRLTAAEPDSPHALWHRAYACAMSGLHWMALADLAAAKELAGAGADQPHWLPLIDALARSDTAALLDIAAGADPARVPLATYLAFLTVEHANSASATIEFGKAALEHSPNCVRVIDAMSAVAGVGYLHITTVESERRLQHAIFMELPDLPGLPDAIRQQLLNARPRADEPRPRGELLAALLTAGRDDDAEPSWEVLARLIEETSFANAYRRVYFFAFQLGAGPMQTMALAREARDAIGEHPYYPVLVALAQWHNPQAVQRQLGGVPFRDLSVASMSFLEIAHELFKTNPDRSPWMDMVAHLDNTAADLERFVQYFLGKELRDLHHPRRLLEVSPHSAMAMAKLIEDDWANVQAKVPQWEQTHAAHPTFAAAMARHYKRQEQFDRAIEMWENVLRAAPDYTAYASLAALYLRQGDEARWLATLEKSLEAEDYGLQHAQARVIIAEHFMSKGEYQRALPYAEAAAETWAHWAMDAAVRCNTGVRDFDRAELWIQRSVDRYGGNGVAYYVWCKRTGRGNLEAARVRVIAFLGTVPEPQRSTLLGILQLIEDQPQRAAEFFSKSMKHTRNPMTGLLLAMTQRKLGDIEASDATLASIAELQGLGEEMLAVQHLAAAMRDGFANGKLDAAKLEQIQAAAPPNSEGIFGYLIGWFHDLSGNEQEATQRYRQICRTARSEDLFAALAAAALRQRGIDPMEVEITGEQ